MNRRYFLPSAILAALVVALTCGTTLAARRTSTNTTNTNEETVLREAYSALRSADHDYHGHRIKAMKAIEEASKAMGVSVRGDGKGHEPQGESDSKLRKAQSLLQGITSGSAKHAHAGKHIEHALKELSIALTIK